MNETQPVTEFPTDSLGRAFYPQTFRSNPDGSPFLNARGQFMPKGGRKPVSARLPQQTAPDAQPAAERPAGTAQPPPAPDFSDVAHLLRDQAAAESAEEPQTGIDGTPLPAGADQFTLAAAGTVSAMSTVAILLLGAHVKPTDQQVAAMVGAYASCYRHYGIAVDVPPWLGPAMATATWIGPHFQDKRSQTRLQAFKAKLAGLVGWWRGKRDAWAAGRAAKAAAETVGGPES